MPSTSPSLPPCKRDTEHRWSLLERCSECGFLRPVPEWISLEEILQIEADNDHTVEVHSLIRQLLAAMQPCDVVSVGAATAQADGDPGTPRCRAQRDGDCEWLMCPQIRDGEPDATGRDCPYYEPDPEE